MLTKWDRCEINMKRQDRPTETEMRSKLELTIVGELATVRAIQKRIIAVIAEETGK